MNAPAKETSRVARFPRFVLLIVVVFLALSAAYTSVLILQRQDTLRSLSRYNVTWLLSQAVFEVARLQAAIGAFRAEPDEDNRDNVELWLDIVANRAKLLHSGDVAPFIREDPEREATVNQLSRAIDAALPMLPRLQEPAVGARAQNSFAEISPKLTRLAATAYVTGNDRISGEILELQRLHWLFAGLLSALVLCSGGLVVTLVFHNRALRRAHAEVQELVNDLTVTGRQLAAAKEQAQDAMGAVEQQYRALRLRDAELNIQNARFDAALNNMSQALCMFSSEQRLIVCNSRFVELFGLGESFQGPGATLNALFAAMALGERFDGDLLAAVRRAQDALMAEARPGTFFREGRDGRAIAVAHQPMADGGWVATYEDITERRRVEARITFMAHHDVLTGLPNRLLFRDRLEEVLANRESNDEGMALLFLDLDHFKNVNDTLGHPVGDALLREVADRLRACVREGDLVARLGGDEFAILQSSTRQRQDAAMLAQRAVEVVCAPYELLGYRAQVGVSIGIALAAGGPGSANPAGSGASADELLKNADMALYHAKSAGRRTWRFFEATMEQELQQRLALEADLREALPLGQLEVMYQPITNLATNRLSGFEALLRWRHPTRGMVSPALFIPVMEDIGLIEGAGRFVLETACKEAATWPAPLKVAVNLSPLQFRGGDIAGTVLSVIRTSGLAPQRLELEITESALLQNDEGVVSALHAFRGIGIRTSLDDFGTAYSSLSYLRRFPFDKIKIDQTFVREMASRADCLAIVNSVAHLAKQLGMATTAEGVETIAQLHAVREAGCTEAQGYYFGQAETAVALRRRFETPDDGTPLQLIA